MWVFFLGSAKHFTADFSFTHTVLIINMQHFTQQHTTKHTEMQEEVIVGDFFYQYLESVLFIPQFYFIGKQTWRNKLNLFLKKLIKLCTVYLLYFSLHTEQNLTLKNYALQLVWCWLWCSHGYKLRCSLF